MILSVVMPAHNAEQFIRDAIESVLEQTVTDFELIILNDGSVDRTGEIIRSYSDQRIVYINNERNLGLPKSCNRGIVAARGNFIARMDADDVCFHDRFEKQLKFLRDHPEIGIVGSDMQVIDENGRRLQILRRPKSHLELKWISLFAIPLFHPTILARAEIMKANPYDTRLSYSEDYELLSRLLFTTKIQFANLSESLLQFRYHKKSFTQNLTPQHLEMSANNIISNLTRYLNLDSKDKDAFVRMRRQGSVSPGDAARIWWIYKKAARQFVSLEELNIGLQCRVYSQFAMITGVLMKRALKRFMPHRDSSASVRTKRI